MDLVSNKIIVNNFEHAFVLIPGGPTISGKYFDEFGAILSTASKSDVHVVRLPNHDENYNEYFNLNYEDTVNGISCYLIDTLKAYQSLTLVSHSFGTYLTLSGLIKSKIANVKKVVLLNTPTEFVRSKRYFEKQEQLGINTEFNIESELDYSNWFKDLLPLYFYDNSFIGYENLLASKTFYFGNQKIVENVPQIEQLLKDDFIKKLQIFAIESSEDLIVPDGNYERLGQLLMGNVQLIRQSGHFPMIDKKLELIKLILMEKN